MVLREFLTTLQNQVLDVVSSEYLETRTTGQSRAYWVAGESQIKRRLAFAIFSDNNVPLLTFWGGGGASGGQQPYEGWSLPKPNSDRPWMSNDPETPFYEIGDALIEDIVGMIKNL